MKSTPLPVYNRLLSEPERNVPSSPHHQFKPNIGVGCVEVGVLCVLSNGEKVYGWNLSDAPIAIHAEVSEHCVITDFSDGSFTQEFFRPEIKSLAPPRPVNPNPYPNGRYTGTCHCAH